MAGIIPTPGFSGQAPGLTDPVFDHAHLNQGGLGDSIIGGDVYRVPSIAGADGRCYFGDDLSIKIIALAVGTNGTVNGLRDETASLIGSSGLGGAGAVDAPPTRLIRPCPDAEAVHRWSAHGPERP